MEEGRGNFCLLEHRCSCDWGRILIKQLLALLITPVKSTEFSYEARIKTNDVKNTTFIPPVVFYLFVLSVLRVEGRAELQNCRIVEGEGKASILACK